MLSFKYRCPRTGQIVHGHVADDLISSGEAYEAVTCTACGGTHLVNQKTGKLLEELRTLRDNPARFVFAEQLGRGAPSRLTILETQIDCA
jgi:DNA-directed RNA polymerase subunit RPC12/RpoP